MSVTSIRHSRDCVLSKPIRIDNNDIIVGYLTGNSYSIHVELREPFRNLSSDCYIPSIARGHYSYEGPYGELRGKQILEDLYYIAKYVDVKRDMLKAKLNENRQQIERASVGRLTMDDFRSKRTELRKKLRVGQIGSTEYQRRVGHIRTEAESLQRRIWAIEEQFWEGYFQTIINMSLRDSIVEILDGKKSL